MGNLLSSKKKQYKALDDYASQYTDYHSYTELDDLDGLRKSIFTIREEMSSKNKELYASIQSLETNINQFNNTIIHQNTTINNQTHLIEASQIQLGSIQEVFENKFKTYSNDLESLLNNDKVLLKKIESLHPETLKTHSKKGIGGGSGVDGGGGGVDGGVNDYGVDDGGCDGGVDGDDDDDNNFSDLIASSYIESNIEFSSFINQ